MDDLTTERLRLRPIRFDDAADVERHIFADPEIVKGLAHDGSDPDVRRRHAKNWSSFGPDGDREFWRACRMGLYVISDRQGALAPDGDFLGVSGMFLERDGEFWSGELFYALARPYHGRGVMSEATAAVVARFRALPGAGALYALYWHQLNPASGRILAGLGFERDGEIPVTEECGRDTALGIRRFELRRLADAAPGERERIAREAGIKLGNLECEGISNAADNRRDLLAALGDGERAAALHPLVDDALAQGRRGLGMALMRLRVR